MLTVVDHPLTQHLLTSLRDQTTPPDEFRQLARTLSLTVVLEATRDLRTERRRVATPLEETDGADLAGTLVAVPILRAGLSMADAVLDLFPRVEVGHLGLERDHETLRPRTYYARMPRLAGRDVLLLDPMLATGGSAIRAAEILRDSGAASLRMACVVAAPEGVRAVQESVPDMPIFAAALDRRLDERGYILPGIGDFGDRLYGTGP